MLQWRGQPTRVHHALFDAGCRPENARSQCPDRGARPASEENTRRRSKWIKCGGPLSESGVQKVCLDWLNSVPGVCCWRRNVGGVVAHHKGKARFVRFGQPGMSDAEGIGPHGVHIEIEFKRLGANATASQVEWLTACRQRGAIAFWADSLDDCVSECRRAFIERGWGWKDQWGAR